MTTLTRQVTANPYVGPRTFTTDDRKRFFGREAEAASLLARVVSERLLLFYAQSGAGKSSLINARLIPQLRKDEGFSVLPVGRVAGQLPPGVEQVDNIFLFNLMASLDQTGQNPGQFASLSLGEFLDHLVTEDGVAWRYDPGAHGEVDADAWEEAGAAPRFALIIDQFEEIVTGHPNRWQERADFFRQLDAALQANPNLWVVLSLREDYVAALDPYAPLLFNRLRARFYMERMGVEAGLEAICKPAELAGRPFAEGVAEHLVDDLRRIRVQGEDDGVHLGESVEPVQLQVVCYQLWEKVSQRAPSPITEQDLEGLNVPMALAQFYERVLGEVAQSSGVSEIDLRTWFERQLITEEGTRGTVFRGAQMTGRLPNQAAELLERQWLIRRAERSGGSWYELMHDSFVGPILRSNHEWRLRQPLVQLAEQWKAAGQPSAMLLRDEQLETLDPSWPSLGPSVQAYIERSQAAQAERENARRERELEQTRALFEEQRMRAEEQQHHAEEQTRSSRRLRWLAVGLALATIIAAAMTVVAFNRAGLAQENAKLAGIEAERAAVEAQRANVEAERAGRERGFARSAFANQLAYGARAELSNRPLVGILLAAEAADLLRAEPGRNEDAVRALREVIARTNSRPWQAHGDKVLDLAFDGAQLVTASQDGITRWDINGWSPDQQRTPPSDNLYDDDFGPIIDAKFSRNGKRAVFLNDPPDLVVLDLQTRRSEQVPLDAVSYRWVFAWSEDGSLLAAGNGLGEIEVLEVAAPPALSVRPRLSRTADAEVTAMAFSPDASWLATATASGVIYLWHLDEAPDSAPLSVTVPSRVDALAFNRAGDGLIAGGAAGIPWAFDTPFVSQPDLFPDLGLTALRTSDFGIASLDVSWDETRLVAGGSDLSPSTRIWDLNWPDLGAIDLRGHAETGVTVVRFSADEEWLVTADGLGYVRLWKTASLPEPGTSDYGQEDPDRPLSLEDLKALACVSAGHVLTETLTGPEIEAIFGRLEPRNVCSKWRRP